MSRLDDHLREELNALVDGELPEERAEALRRLLGQDDEVRRAYEELKATAALVRGLPAERAPEDLRERVHTRLRPAAPVKAFPWRAVAAVAAVLLAAVGALVGFGGDDEPAPPPYRQASGEQRTEKSGKREGARGMLREEKAVPATESELAGEARMRDDAGEPAAAPTAPTAPAEAKEETGAKKAATLALLDALEKGADLKDAEQRARYFRELDALTPDRLAVHFERVANRALLDAEVAARKKSVPAPAAAFTVANAKDAQAILATLARRFGAKPTAIADAAPEPKFTVREAAGRQREKRLTLQLTAKERKLAEAWLKSLRLPAASPSLGAPQKSRGAPKGDEGADGGPKKEPFVVRLVWEEEE